MAIGANYNTCVNNYSWFAVSELRLMRGENSFSFAILKWAKHSDCRDDGFDRPSVFELPRYVGLKVGFTFLPSAWHSSGTVVVLYIAFITSWHK
jgi:hypothetical protein